MQQQDVFDQIQKGQPAPQSSATPPSAQPAPQGQGDVFDQLTSGTSDSTAQVPPTPSDPNAVHIDPSDNIVTKGLKSVAAVGAGMGDSLLGTASGAADLLNLPGASDYLHGQQNKVEAENAENPTLNKVGYGGETLMEFLLGDEALKGLSLGDKLAKSAGIAKALENSPRLMKALKIGADSLRAGVTQGSLATIKSGGDVKQGLEQGAIAGGLYGTGEAALTGIPPVYSKLFDTNSIQPSLQNGVRDVLNIVAKDAGVTPSPAQSIRDVAGNLSDAILARSKAAYQALDDATGGRFQRFDDALKNINQRLRETTGLDDDAEANLLQRKAEVEASQSQVFDQAKTAGVDPKLVDSARNDYKKAMALQDLDRQLKMSATGMRPELAGTNSSPEILDPKKLFSRTNKLFDSGRLQQALGDDNAQQLIQHADTAFLKQQKIVNRQKIAKTAAAYAGVGAAAGTAGHALNDWLK